MTVEALRERILRGDYPEGEPLRQDALADELGVQPHPRARSTPSARGRGAGHVQPAPRRRRVDALARRDRGAVRAARRHRMRAAAARRSEHRRRASRARHRCVDEFDAALEAGESERCGPLNWRFHSALYAPARRNLTMGVLQKLHQHSDRYFRMHVVLARGGARANQEHRQIAEAVREQDVKAALRLLRAHILGAGQSLVELLEKERGTQVAEAAHRNERLSSYQRIYAAVRRIPAWASLHVRRDCPRRGARRTGATSRLRAQRTTRGNQRPLASGHQCPGTIEPRAFGERSGHHAATATGSRRRRRRTPGAVCRSRNSAGESAKRNDAPAKSAQPEKPDSPTHSEDGSSSTDADVCAGERDDGCRRKIFDNNGLRG